MGPLGERPSGPLREARVPSVFRAVGVEVGQGQIGSDMLGARGVAGEIGHVKVKFEGGRLCGCGEYGCLEAYAGGVNLEAWMKESGLEGGAAELEVQAHNGNAEALRLWDFASSSLALVIANQVTVLNPGMVVLGGGVLVRWNFVREPVGAWIPIANLASNGVKNVSRLAVSPNGRWLAFVAEPVAP